MLKMGPLLETYKHVIWDWNGTLLNDLDYCISTVNSILRTHQLPQVDINSYRQVFGFPVKNYYKKLGFDFDKESFESLGSKFMDMYAKNVNQCDLHFGARELLGAIKNSGKFQSILSATEQSFLNHLISSYELTHNFHHVYGIDNVYAASKLESGRELIRASGISPQDTVLIGDTDHDHEVGEALGINVILVSHGHHSHERLEQLHHTVVRFE